MRIFHFNTERTWRGGERQTLYTAKGLADRGHWSAVVARPGFPLYEHAEEAGLPVLPFAHFSPLSPVAALRLAWLAAKHDVDVILCQTSHAVSLAALARRLGLKATVVAVRRVDFIVNNSHKFNRCHGVIAISRAIRTVLLTSDVRPDLVSVIPSGVDTSIEPRRSREEVRAEFWQGDFQLFGSVGHLANHKGYDVLLRSWPRVIKEHPKARLLLVGEGEERALLERIIRENNIGESVKLAGFREHPADYIAAFDWYLQPSRTEGLGSTVIDALLMKTPVIATRAGGIPEVLNDGKHGVLVEPDDEQSLSRALLKAARGEVTIDTAAAREWACDQYSLERMVNQTETLLKDTIPG